jgi:hypothetical protein
MRLLFCLLFNFTSFDVVLRVGHAARFCLLA